jgi:hypothetical protein
MRRWPATTSTHSNWTPLTLGPHPSLSQTPLLVIQRVRTDTAVTCGGRPFCGRVEARVRENRESPLWHPAPAASSSNIRLVLECLGLATWVLRGCRGWLTSTRSTSVAGGRRRRTAPASARPRALFRTDSGERSQLPEEFGSPRLLELAPSDPPVGGAFLMPMIASRAVTAGCMN